MQIQLSEHFTYRKLLRFVLPSIIMMIFTSIYSVVDGLFVSNFVGKTALAAINLTLPIIMGLSALGFMIGTGGSAIVARMLGEKKEDKANAYFSMLIYATMLGGIFLSVLGAILIPSICSLLGAKGELLSDCVLYARLSFISMPAFMLQNVFQSFFVTAEKPHLGLYVIIAAGMTNMVLDFLFVGVWGFGLAGAAIATVCGELIGGLFPVIYFSRKNSSLPVWGTCPKMALSRELFPAPLGPIRATIWPQWMCRSTCSNTVVSPSCSPRSVARRQQAPWQPMSWRPGCLSMRILL